MAEKTQFYTDKEGEVHPIRKSPGYEDAKTGRRGRHGGATATAGNDHAAHIERLKSSYAAAKERRDAARLSYDEARAKDASLHHEFNRLSMRDRRSAYGRYKGRFDEQRGRVETAKRQLDAAQREVDAFGKALVS